MATTRNAVPEKEDNLAYALSELAAMDITPVQKGENVEALARDNVQLLVNKLFETLPTEDTDTGKVGILRNHYSAPTDEFRCPRAKPCPREKVKTRWEKFAEEKGIHKKKKSKLVYDDVSGDWLRRYGYGGIKQVQESRNIMMEGKFGPDAYDDPFKAKKDAKKLDVAKQKLRQMRNKVESAGFRMGAVNLDEKGANRGKDGLNEALRRAQVSSASAGKFDRRADGEKIVAGTGRRKSKVNTAVKGDAERGGYLKMLDKLENKKEILNVQKSANFAQTAKEGKNRAKKATGQGKGKPGKGKNAKKNMGKKGSTKKAGKK